MKIAEVSKRYGVSTDTLRYYERIGLLRHVPRNKSGIRDYDAASCNAVEFVKCMQLIEQGDETTAARKELLSQQSEAIRARIADLERALERLEYKIENYDEIMADSERALRPED